MNEKNYSRKTKVQLLYFFVILIIITISLMVLYFYVYKKFNKESKIPISSKESTSESSSVIGEEDVDPNISFSYSTSKKISSILKMFSKSPNIVTRPIQISQFALRDKYNESTMNLTYLQSEGGSLFLRNKVTILQQLDFLFKHQTIYLGTTKNLVLEFNIALFNFYKNDGKNFQNNHTLNQLLLMSDKKWEAMHDFIQWVFPVFETSIFNPIAVMLPFFAKKLKPYVQNRMPKLMNRFLIFLQNKENNIPVKDRLWFKNTDHNIKRITRSIISTRLFGLNELSDKMVYYLEFLVVQCKINPTKFISLRYFLEAMQVTEI
ncbi:hypothetical protein NUSPORA_00550 [Nucleospora cyclopteri]